MKQGTSLLKLATKSIIVFSLCLTVSQAKPENKIKLSKPIHKLADVTLCFMECYIKSKKGTKKHIKKTNKKLVLIFASPTKHHKINR